MKKYLLFLITIFCITLTLNAQEQYEVTCESPLNVRASASINGKVLGCLPKGTSVDVYDVEGGWAVIMYEGKEAYVSAKYLQKCAETLSEDKQNSMIDFMDKINLRQFATRDVEWMAYIIMGLSVVLFIVRRFVREGKKYLIDGAYIFNLVLFALVCVLELVYVLKMGSDAIWFCSPSYVGWLVTVIGFIIFAFLVYNQLLCFFDILNDIRYNAGDFDVRIGIFSWPVAIVAAIIAGITDCEDCLMWILIILGVCQLIQMILIIKGVTQYGGFFYSLLTIVMYFLGAVSTLLVLLQFLALLIIVIIVCVIFMALLSASASSSSSSSSSGSSSGQSKNDQKGYLYPSDGFGSISGRFSDDNTFHENGGGTYDKQSDGSWKKREW